MRIAILRSHFLIMKCVHAEGLFVSEERMIVSEETTAHTFRLIEIIPRERQGLRARGGCCRTDSGS